VEVRGRLDAPAALPLGKDPVICWRGVWMSSWRGFGKEGFLPLPEFGPRTVQAIVGRYTDWAIPAAVIVSQILNQLVPSMYLILRHISCFALKFMDPEGVLGADLRHFAESHGPSFNWIWDCRSQRILLFFFNYILERNNWKWWLQSRWEDASFFHLSLSSSCNRYFYISQETDWPGKFCTTESPVTEMRMLSDFLNHTVIGLETFLASCLSTYWHILRMYLKNLLRTNSVFFFMAHASRASHSPSTRGVNVLQQWPSSELSSCSLPSFVQLFLTDYSTASLINWRTCCEKRHVEPCFTK
jgi:hypothetical protein